MGHNAILELAGSIGRLDAAELSAAAAHSPGPAKLTSNAAAKSVETAFEPLFFKPIPP